MTTEQVRNLLMRIAYDGTDFFGWQIQPRHPTIQATLADVLLRVCGEQMQVSGSGRTDAGVHACGQAANVKIRSPIPCPNLQKALNRLLPDTIRVLSIEEVPESFHARHDASSKIYRYRMYRADICPPHLARYVLPYPYPLDEDAMARAAACFEGTRDFRSFAAADEADHNEPKSCIRTIFSSRFERVRDELIYTVEGSGFLRHMVRNIVGTLMEVGRGRITADAITQILAAQERAAAGPTAPARGLHLVSVFYPPEALVFPSMDKVTDPAKIGSDRLPGQGHQEDRE